MRENMLIKQKTRWIMHKFKQFRTLITVHFQCFAVIKCELLSEDPSTSSSLWRQIHPFFKPQMILWEAEWAKNKTSTQAHRQKMLGKPGGLKSLANKVACFHQYLGEKLLQNNQSLRLLCLHGWKAAALSLMLGFFSCFMRKMLQKCGGCGC